MKHEMISVLEMRMTTMTMLTTMDNVNGDKYEEVNGDEYEHEDIGEMLIKTIPFSETRITILMMMLCLPIFK